VWPHRQTHRPFEAQYENNFDFDEKTAPLHVTQTSKHSHNFIEYKYIVYNCRQQSGRRLLECRQMENKANLTNDAKVNMSTFGDQNVFGAKRKIVAAVTCAIGQQRFTILMNSLFSFCVERNSKVKSRQ
jgi:hypothetical protein